MKTSLLLLLGVVPICNAEPSPSVRYLMNEPVTLFDWGIVGKEIVFGEKK